MEFDLFLDPPVVGSVKWLGHVLSGLLKGRLWPLIFSVYWMAL